MLAVLLFLQDMAAITMNEQHVRLLIIDVFIFISFLPVNKLVDNAQMARANQVPVC